MKANPDEGNPIERSLNALALLSSGEPQYLPLVREQVEWASQYSDPERRSLPLVVLRPRQHPAGRVRPGHRRSQLHAGPEAHHHGNRPRTERGRFVGTPVRASERATGRLRHDERPGLAADRFAHPGARGRRRRSGAGRGDREERAAASLLRRQGERPLRRPPSVDPDARRQRQERNCRADVPSARTTPRPPSTSRG